MIGEILVLFMYITRLASKEIFSPSNKIHREVGRAKDLSAPLYVGVSHKLPVTMRQEGLLQNSDHINPENLHFLIKVKVKVSPTTGRRDGPRGSG